MEGKAMEMVKFLLYATAVSAFALSVSVGTQDQSGFISIDCGLSPNSSYEDQTTGIFYVSEENYIETGVIQNISPEFKSTGLRKPYWNLRSFPVGVKNCYTLKPTQGKGNKYLIRAEFMYGNYDGKAEVPEFDVSLGANRWRTVRLVDASTVTPMEIIHIPSSQYIHVCLVNTGFGTPFISVLELRLLSNNTYEAESGSLELYGRLSSALVNNQTVRFPDDVFDRIWSAPVIDESWKVVSTNLTIHNTLQNYYQPPSTVMKSMLVPRNSSGPLIFNFVRDDSTTQFYFYMHFADIDVNVTQGNRTREFNIYLNEELWHGPVIPAYLQTTTVASKSPEKGLGFQFLMNRTQNSTLPPLINAIEVYLVMPFLQSPTNQEDVDAIKNIKSFYGVKRIWQGDPCAPEGYMWDGLNCSYEGYNPPRITSLNLSSSGLSGDISSYISKLTMLKSLDLSNNSLSGPVPDFLSELPYLTILNLERNKLKGSIPVKLLERSKNKALSLRVNGNPDLCSSDLCKNSKQGLIVTLVASIFGILFLFLTAVEFYWTLREREQDVSVENVGRDSAETNMREQELRTIRQQFTYPEVINITNNFERPVGKGRLGTVYHGYLGDTQVAVKMLSSSSVKSYNQLQAEVSLIIKLHHRNLTSLVGCCNEDGNVGLIYEYIANGNLEKYLSEKILDNLSWKKRLVIAMDAAQGLEYLHCCCKPAVIHGNLKPTNILLEQSFHAKLSDFGLSTLFPLDGDTNVSSVYLDIENTVSNKFSEKSDVYSFGVVLLEIITGQSAIAENQEKTHITQWVSSMLAKGDIEKIADPRISGDFNVNSVWKAVELAMSCVSPTCAKRPNMSDVVMELDNCLAMEIARTQGHETESFQMVTVNMVTESTPLAR